MKHKFTLIVGLFLATTAMQAQVTIGSTKNPLNGTLLMLDDGTIDNSNASVNAMKGLGLPRVELTNLKPQNPADLSLSIGGSGDWSLDEHAGLMVYNVKEGDVCSPIPVGLYVWAGKQWEGIGIEEEKSPDVYYYKDERDPTDIVEYPYRNFGVDAGDWMLMNMRATKFDSDVTGISFDPSLSPQTGDGSATEPIWAYPNLYGANANDDVIFKLDKAMGLLYNWIAATGGQNTSDVDQGEGEGDNLNGIPPTPNPIPGNVLQVGVQGICPNGWHVPSDKEWSILSKELSEHPEKYTDGATAVTWDPIWNYLSGAEVIPGAHHGESMKAPCPLPKYALDVFGKSVSREAGGFHLLLPGRTDGPLAALYGSTAYMWTSSLHKPKATFRSASAWARLLQRSDNGSKRTTPSILFLNSVRCKRN